MCYTGAAYGTLLKAVTYILNRQLFILKAHFVGVAVETAPRPYLLNMDV